MSAHVREPVPDSAAAGEGEGAADRDREELARHGAQRVGASGEPFDPERHEAIDVRESSEAPDRGVLEVARSG